MEINTYIATGGQTGDSWRPVRVKWLEWERLAMAEGLPEIHLNSEYKERGWYFLYQAQHFVPDVTAQMMDWFWSNQEKCYYLWAPGSHKCFQWIREPWKYGFTNAEHVVVKTMLPGQDLQLAIPGGEVNGHTLIEKFNMDVYPFDTCLEHCVLEGSREEDGTLWTLTAHSWEDTEGGIVHRVAVCVNTYVNGMRILPPDEFPLPLGAKNVVAHVEYEASTWPQFLPKLYDAWKNHPDPTQNVFFDLSVRCIGPCRWTYVKDNTKPIV